MNEQLIKDLIDKIMVGDITQEERKYILSLIDGKPELQAYYAEVTSMMENLQSIADIKPYDPQDLLSARNELFSSIDDTQNGFTWIHMAASIAATFLLTLSYFSYFSNSTLDVSSLPGSEVVSLNDNMNLLDLDVKMIDGKKVSFEGRAINNFLLEGDIKDERIQHVFQKTAVSDLSIEKRIRAISLLNESDNNNDLLMSIYKNEENNSQIRLTALNKLSELMKDTDLASVYINLLKEENNFQMQRVLLETLIKHAEQNQTIGELEKMLGK